MKKLFYLLFLPVFLLAQTNEKNKFSVIGLDRMNVVYRGIPNPISIAVNDAKSFKISGDGVVKTDEGKYIIRPGAGTETKVFVEIEKNDGSKVVEEHTFRIKGLPTISGTLNGKDSEVILIRNQINEVIISTDFVGFLFDYNPNSEFFKVNSFEIKFSNNEIFKIIGNKFNKDSLYKISKLKKGDSFEINNINYGPPMDGLKKRAFPIKVILED